MKGDAILKGPVCYFTIAMMLAGMIILLNACALDEVFTFWNPKVETPALPVKVKVVYDGNGNDVGIVPTDENLYDPGATVTILANSGGLGSSGNTFTGWNTNSNGSGTGYRASTETPERFTIGDKDVTLYAVWSRDLYIKAGETYAGSVKGQAVHIAEGGMLDMKGDSTLLFLELADININCAKLITGSIKSNGYNIYFDENRVQNSAFGAWTYGLPGGGRLMPGFPADIEVTVNAVHYIDGMEKNYSNEDITIEAGSVNRSAVYVKNGGIATIKQSSITASSSNRTINSSPGSGTRWGLGSALYASFAGTLIADDIKITARGQASSGAHALFLGRVKLTNSSIRCDDEGGNSYGVQATYGGNIDLENVSIEAWTGNGSILATAAGGGTITAKNVTGVAHGRESAGIFADRYGYVSVEGSNLKSENDSSVVICSGGATSVEDSTLISGATAVKIKPSGRNCRTPGSGTFTNTRIISGGDAFYYNGISADIIVKDGTTIEIPRGSMLIKADSIKGTTAGSTEKPDLTRGTFTAKNVTLNGDIELAEDGTALVLSLKDNARYNGAVNGASVAIDGTSMWTVTETCIIAGIDIYSASRIHCPSGFRVYYDAGINNIGKIILNGGGELVPIQES